MDFKRVKEVAVAIAELAWDSGEDFEKLCDKVERLVAQGKRYSEAYEMVAKEVKR